MNQIPFLLILFRLALAPIMILVAYFHIPYVGNLLAILLVCGILSDVFDGIIARKLNISTDGLRKWDSNVDAVFLVATIISAWILFQNEVEEKKIYVLIIVSFELLTYLVCYLKFKKLPANHAYSSKLFAVLICIALCTLFLTGNWGFIFPIMFAVGVISYLDNLLILMLLKTYQVDNKYFWKVI